MSNPHLVLMIGLGQTSQSVLEQAKTYFDQMGAVERLETVCFTPQRDVYHAGHYSLALSEDDLKQLYYDHNVRTWSSANWIHWGESLTSNRLYGKLAVLHHLTAIDQHIDEAIQQLITRNRQYERLHIYLVAPLHDPFASGGLIDMAYLMLKKAGAFHKTYGLFLTPGMENDPLAYTKQDDQQLQQAVTYAVLRELQFLTSHESFYLNHQRDLPITHSNRSPFANGTWYVVGGTYDEGGNPLEYGQTNWQIAAFTYLQTQTDFRDAIPNRHTAQTFNSFLVHRHQPLVEREAIDQALPLLQWMSRKLSEIHPEDTATLETFLPDPIDTFEGESRADFEQKRINLGQTGSESRTVGRIMQDMDARYRETTDTLYQYQLALQSHTDKLLADPRLNPENSASIFAERRQQANQTIGTLNDSYGRLTVNFKQHIANLEQHVRDLEDQNVHAANRLRMERIRLNYGLNSQLNILFLAVLGIVFLIVAVGMMIANLWLQLIFWSFVLIVAIFLTITFYQFQKGAQARTDFVSFQREVIQRQKDLIEAQIRLTYLKQIEQRLMSTLQYQGGNISRTQHLLNTLEAFSDEIGKKVRVMGEGITWEVNDAVWRNLSSQLVQTLWERSQSEFTKTTLKNTLLQVIEQRGLLQQDTHAADQLRKNIQDGLVNSYAPMLAIHVPKIHDSYQQAIIQRVGVGGVSRTITSHPIISDLLKDRKLGDQLILLNTPSSQSETADIYTVKVRTHIAIGALQDLQQWQQSYHNYIQVVYNDQLQSYHSFVHPTRWGMAVPDIGIAPINPNRPHFVMQFVFLLHFGNHFYELVTYARHLCDMLDVAYDPTQPNSIHYDELCSQLQKRPDVQASILQSIEATSPQDSSAWEAVKRQLRDTQFISSEQFADWEAWIAYQISKTLKNTQSESEQTFLERMYLLITNGGETFDDER